MSDASMIRRWAGAAFRRADSARDERAATKPRQFEDFLRDLAGWLPPIRERASAIRALATAAEVHASALRGQPDVALAQGFARAIADWRVDSTQVRAARNLAPTLACIAEACRRRLGLTPHPVQLAGTRSLLAGELAEMQTGEGKTLVAAMAATAMAGTGAAVHVISTNDYLAQRDCEAMTPLFELFGLSAGFVCGGMTAEQRRAAYAHPICYAAGKEVVFDYLKDRLKGHGREPLRVAQLRQLEADNSDAPATPLIPALHFAIVDEADSVLIDEARTPMILSREAPAVIPEALIAWAIAAAAGLHPARDYQLKPTRDVELQPAALLRCAALPANIPAVWHSPGWRLRLLRQALTALHLYHRDQHYILSEDKVQIVDESTGRVMPDRSWEEGLHQLIEAKEGMPLSGGRETLERMTYQRFFRRYYLVSGLTGTAAEAKRELWMVYGLKVRRIPPDRPNRRRRARDQCLSSLGQKWPAVAQAAEAAATRGQAVLIGTRSVQASEQLSAELTRRGTGHVVLNARQDAEEAAIVAQAGQAGRITVATNMAGRGTDIRPDLAARQAGGLHVILTEFHESPRIDRQLFGRSGRQGEPGTVQAIVAADDNLFKTLPQWLRRELPGGGNLARQSMLRWALRRAQAKAERRAYQTRLQTMHNDKHLLQQIGFAGPVL